MPVITCALKLILRRLNTLLRHIPTAIARAIVEPNHVSSEQRDTRRTNTIDGELNSSKSRPENQLNSVTNQLPQLQVVLQTFMVMHNGDQTNNRHQLTNNTNRSSKNLKTNNS